MDEDTKKIIHILHEGFTLCKFSSEVPRDWPKGHIWVGIGEGISYATCVNCIRIFNKISLIKLVSL